MKEALSIKTERADDIPLLLTHMQRMQVAIPLDKHFPTHGLRKELSMGELTVVWLTHILSQADHRINRVQDWASRRLTTLCGCGLEKLTPLDVTDDRLADVLRFLLSQRMTPLRHYPNNCLSATYSPVCQIALNRPDKPVKCIGSLDHCDAIIRPGDDGEREPAQVHFLSVSHHNSPPIDHPTTRQEYRSRMTERYSHPCSVDVPAVCGLLLFR